MRKTLIALGLGAAAFSMMDKKQRKRITRFIQPIRNMEMAEMMPSKRTIDNIRKRIMRSF